MAVALVLVVNRFVFPSRKKRQFLWNLRTLVRLQGYYWGMVARGAAGSWRPEEAGVEIFR